MSQHEQPLPLSDQTIKQLAAIGIIFDPNRYFTHNGLKLRHRPLTDEPTNPKYSGFSVKSTPEFINDSSQDLAQATLEPWTHTPPQLIIGPGQVTDLPIRGKARFVYHSHKKTKILDYDADKPSDIFTQITYGPDTHICWFAGEDGLTLDEVWSPPFESSKITDLSLWDSSLPLSFRLTILKLLTQELVHRHLSNINTHLPRLRRSNRSNTQR